MGSRLWIQGDWLGYIVQSKSSPNSAASNPKFLSSSCYLSPGALIWVVLVVGEICWDELCLPHRDIRAAEGQGHRSVSRGAQAGGAGAPGRGPQLGKMLGLWGQTGLAGFNFQLQHAPCPGPWMFIASEFHFYPVGLTIISKGRREDLGGDTRQQKSIKLRVWQGISTISSDLPPHPTHTHYHLHHRAMRKL